MPSFHWQRQSQIGENSMQSLLMNLLRGLAALQVAAAHLRAETFPGLRDLHDPPLAYTALAFLTGFAHQAVMVFFLISGWLVGGSLLDKIGQPHALRAYAIDRATRLWTVLLPTLVVMLGVGLASGAIAPAPAPIDAGHDYSAASFVGNLLGLQTIVVPRFGGNYPLWSLANETWYYVLFPLLLLVFAGRGWPRRLACAATLAGAVALLPPVLVLYFGIWLLGAAFSRIRIDCGVGVRVLLLAAAGAISVYYRIYGVNDDIHVASFGQDLLCTMPVVVLLAMMHMRMNPAARLLRVLGRLGKWLSEFSFTLYVLHVPVIDLLQHLGRTELGREQLDPARPEDFALYFAMLAIILASAWLSYLLFERNTYRVRRFVKQALLPKRTQASAAAVFTAD